MKRSAIVAISLGSLLIGAAGMYTVDRVVEERFPQLTASAANSDIQKFQQAYELVSDKYVIDVKDEKLIEGAISGMLSVLDDPYSVYMNEETMTSFQQSLDSSFEGIGAEVSKTGENLIIVSPIKNSPAEKAGLKPNDEITEVDGKSIKQLSQYDAVLKIRGKKGTTVTLTIKRPGVEQLLTFKVVRDEIPQYTVFSEMKKEAGQNIGYLHITSFSEDTAKEFREQLQSLEKQDMDALLIDVRGNPGGYLQSVEEILNELVVSDKPIVQIEYRDGKRGKINSENKTKKPYPIKMLIDGGSASASEILAGGLNETMGVELIGEKTFGKGTVQQAIPFSDGSSIKLTLSKWLTPDGNWINKKGIKPTIEVKQPDYYNAVPIDAKNTLKFDMTGEQVKNTQVMLEGLGYTPKRTDGYFSKETEVAVQTFQKENGLVVTGQVDEKTAIALQNKLIEKISSGVDDLQLKAALKAF